ncbi:MAG TPA: alpha/beta fold hydrolase [Syntrophales bacterium]|nr:alpha/beta fold hydrolase [Syntrophales bacterium]
MTEKFIPKPWARNPHIQTILGSLKIRSRGRHPITDFAVDTIIDGGNGVRLLGNHSSHPENHGAGLITLIHGWEGSSDSTYILSTSKYLYDKGYDIFRLNLRDHGNSHHLNEGLFHGALIEETFHAVRNISLLSKGNPYYIIGFSLGGNFALRIALKHSLSIIPNLKQVICISPALDPYKATLSIDESFPIYRHYFLNKWKNSLRKKQSLFPDKYNFADILKVKTCMGLTEAIMPYYPDFCSYREYFNQYTLLDNIFDDLSIPVTIIASKDDPIVPIHDIYGLSCNKYLRLSVQAYGGHSGFIDFFPFKCWYEYEIEQIIL